MAKNHMFRRDGWTRFDHGLMYFVEFRNCFSAYHFLNFFLGMLNVLFDLGCTFFGKKGGIRIFEIQII